MTGNLEIRPIQPGDEQDRRRLWTAYPAFRIADKTPFIVYQKTL